MKKTTTLETEVVVVGSGPGGATTARELSRRGKKVIICEAGAYHRRFGYAPFLLNMLEKFGLTFSQEGTWVFHPKTVGGASVIFCGTAFKPPLWLKEKYGIDLTEEVEEIFREIPIQPLPERLIGPAARRIMESAVAAGLDWNPLDKWIRPEKCRPNCGKCSLGCPVEGAKWTAREFVEEARKLGAELLTNTRVNRLLVEGGKTVGVEAESPEGRLSIHAQTVVLSGGGKANPLILQRAGLDKAGQGFFADPLWFVGGPSEYPGSIHDIPMTAGAHLEEEGIVMTDFTLSPTILAGFLAHAGAKGMASLPRVAGINKTLIIMIKVRDGLDGQINPDGSFSKPIDSETRKKLDQGAALAEEILVKAKVNRKELFKTTTIAAHPGGTVRIGGLLDENCQTPIENCYCMDTTVIPEPWGLPPSVTVVAMAKRLANRLAGNQSS
jgi:choline dehydrogenase-like flavoprotein